MESKITTAKEVAGQVKNGDHIMVGGFLQGGTPDLSIRELIKNNLQDLQLTSNDTGREGCAVYDLVGSGSVSKINSSYIGANPYTGQMLIDDPASVTLFPQGTLAEVIRAGGFGLGGVLTPVGLGTIVEEGKQIIVVDGEKYLLEKPLKADFAFIKANEADQYGNLLIRGTSKNFNFVMATAADYVVAEVDTIIDDNHLDPDQITVPGNLVDALILRGASDE